MLLTEFGISHSIVYYCDLLDQPYSKHYYQDFFISSHLFSLKSYFTFSSIQDDLKMQTDIQGLSHGPWLLQLQESAHSTLRYIFCKYYQSTMLYRAASTVVISVQIAHYIVLIRIFIAYVPHKKTKRLFWFSSKQFILSLNFSFVSPVLFQWYSKQNFQHKLKGNN